MFKNDFYIPQLPVGLIHPLGWTGWMDPYPHLHPPTWPTLTREEFAQFLEDLCQAVEDWGMQDETELVGK